jgi:hypothetical protein
MDTRKKNWSSGLKKEDRFPIQGNPYEKFFSRGLEVQAQC